MSTLRERWTRRTPYQGLGSHNVQSDVTIETR